MTRARVVLLWEKLESPEAYEESWDSASLLGEALTEAVKMCVSILANNE